jgi:hypothetical protein
VWPSAGAGTGWLVERKLLREAETRERLGGSERDDVADLLVLYGEHVEADRQVAAGLGFSPVDAKRASWPLARVGR